MSSKKWNGEISEQIIRQLKAINHSVLPILQFLQSGKKMNEEISKQIIRRLKFINKSVLINGSTIGTKLVLSKRKHNKNVLKNIGINLLTIQKNMIRIHNRVETLPKKESGIIKEIKSISKNINFSLKMIKNLIAPPPFKCPEGFRCVSVGLGPAVALELGVPKTPSTGFETFIGGKIFGVSIGGVTISTSKPRVTLGGEFGVGLAELTIALENIDIKSGFVTYTIHGKVCIGPNIDSLRICTQFDEIIAELPV